MNVPRTAAQQVPPATVGVGGTLPFGYHTSGCRDWYSVHQTGGASPTNCRHLCLPTPRPSSSSRGVLLTVTQQDTVGDQGTATAPVHAGFPLLSLSLPHLPSHHGHCAGLCTHAFTPPGQVGSLLQALQCLPPLSLSHNLMAILSL